MTDTEAGTGTDAGLNQYVRDQLAIFRKNYPERDFWHVPHYVKPDAWCSKLKEHETADVVAYSPEHLLEEVAGYDKNFGREERRQQGA